MDDNSIDILLKLTDELTPALAKAQAALRDAAGKIGQSTEPANDSLKRLNQSSADWFTTITGGVTVGNVLSDAIERIASMAIDAAKALPELALQGARVDDVADAYARLTTQAGMLGGALLDTLRKGTHDTIDDFTLMKRVNQDLAAGLNLTDDQFSLLSRGAFALAQATGGNVKDALDTMSDAMVTGRAKAVALLTGKVDLKAAEEAYAAKLGHTSDELTAESKLEADREAILKAVGGAVDRLGEQTDGLDEKVDQAKASWINFTNELGRAIATSPVLMEALDGLRQILIDTFGGNREEAVRRITKAIDDAIVTLIGLESYSVKAAGAAAEGWHALLVVVDTLYNSVLSLQKGMITLNIAAMQARSYVEPWNDFSGAMDEAERHVAEINRTIAENKKAIAEHEKSEAAWAVTSQELSDKFEGLSLKLAQTRDRTIEFVGPINQATSGVAGAGAAAATAGDQFQTSATKARAYREAWEQLAAVGETLIETYSEINPLLRDQIEYYLRAGASVATLAAAYPELKETQIKAVEEVLKIEKESLKQAGELWNEYFALRVAHGGTTTQAQIAQTEAWRKNEIAKLKESDADWVDHYNAINAVADEKLQGILVDWDAVRKNSKAALQETADKAAATFDYMLAHSDQFTIEVLKHFEDLKIAGQQAADAWGTSYEENAQKALDAIKKVDSAKQGMSGTFSFIPGGQTDPDVEALIGAGYTIGEALAILGGYAGHIAPHHHAAGGDMAAHEVGWVGEAGPELWVPQTAGTVIPHGAGGATVIVPVTIQGNVFGTKAEMTRAVHDAVTAGLKRTGVRL
jgi:hypothetical protein